VPSFCRHNRLEATCPICARRAAAGAASPRRPASRPAREPSSAGRRRTPRAAGDLRVRRVARAADDGFEHELVPGLRATADAERLADELAFSVARLRELEEDPPGLYADVALATDPEEAAWLAFLIAYLSPVEGDAPFAAVERARTTWASGELPDLEGVVLGPRAAHDPRAGVATLAAYRAWAARAGSQAAALTGEAGWTPERRFERDFERLALPGLGRGPRFEVLVLLGRLGVADVRAASLHLGDGTDPVTAAAKRVFGIGDPLNLRRRSGALAQDTGVPIEALDLALFNWARTPDDRATAGARATADPERRAAIGRALGLG
jgi:Alpha-glutamyl/putrescinyl thymine pyrophosphorylase clade 3